MTHVPEQPEYPMGTGDTVRCSLAGWLHPPDTPISNLCDALARAGCPLVPSVQERLRFEPLLAELSAGFVNLPADQVDSQIGSALRRLVEFLDVDRGGLAEMLPDPKQLVLTHFFHRPGVPPHTRIRLDPFPAAWRSLQPLE